MLTNLLDICSYDEKLQPLRSLGEKKLPDGRLSAICIRNASEGFKFNVIADIPARKIIVTSDALAAKSAARKLASWGLKVKYLPAREDVLVARKNAATATVHERMEALSSFAFDEADAVVLSADCLLQSFPKRELVKKFSVLFSKDDVISPQEATRKLVMAGYSRQDMIADVGDFALRGDILDVYTPKGAYRLNFFDEFVENIKAIDVDTMVTSNEVSRLLIYPASDILLDEEGLKLTSERLKARLSVKYAAQTLSGLSVGACSPAGVWGLPFMSESVEGVLDFFDDDRPSVVVLDEPKVIFEKLNLLKKEFDGRISALTSAGEILEEHKKAYFEVSAVKRRLEFARKLGFCSLFLSNALFEPLTIIDAPTKAVTKYYLDPASMGTELRSFCANQMKVIICTGSRERAKSVVESLRDLDVYSEYSEDGDADCSVAVTPLSVEVGYIYARQKLVLVGVSECIGKHVGESVVSKKSGFIAPKAGDYVVHRVHGVGLCEGTVRMKTGEFEKDYIVLRYRDGDVLYVATDQTNNLQKFVGEQNPTLNKLGGKEFEKEKQKVRKSVRAMALNLVDVYAKREKQRGFKYDADTVWQKEFEDSFEYEETYDQLKAIGDVKADMEAGRIMDRLIVGDVGFGKTEVAFRAMFKTVLDSKQAVLIAPTTILARQHYENLLPRLKPFGITLGLLTRLQSGKENEKIIEQLASGEMNMVIATHKVLSKNVQFHDLGLVVLDEEQRFGVEHKETLKARYPIVNVLTLSATPIPRTLNMSLSGIRDISMLETPPLGRLPVQTYVVGYSDAIATDAISRETARGGQTLVLLNQIDALEPYANRLRALLPDVRITTAHGQMPPNLLEQRISAFYDKQFDVLISTSIIENGIDLPDANTLIVIDSERFGLAQLYQLRGRVGRRGALANAYFTIPANGAISDVAEKRLSTLLDNTEIGSGFKIALADLSIRGAGNLLGAEQSGHIEKVGYEMYLEILDEAIREIKTGVKAKPIRDAEMKVDVRAYIPDGYVSSRDKLKLLKQISEVSSVAMKSRLIAELSDIYGYVDRPIENLIDVALLKNLASRQDVSRIVINRMGAGANFYDADVFKNEELMKAVADNRDICVLTDTIPPTLIFDVDKLTAEQKLERLIDFFASVA